MIGTIVNTCCIIVGSVAGSILRRGIKAKKLLDQARESGVYWNNYTWEIRSRFKD